MGIFQKIKSSSAAGAEKKPHAAETKAIIDAVPDGLIVLDPNGVIVDINPAVTKMLGYTPEERIGKSFDELGESIKAEDIKKFMKLFGKLIETGYVEPTETVLRAKDGRKLPMSVTYSLVKDDDGNPKNIIASFRDITEFKRLQKKEKQTFIAMAATEKEKRALAEKIAKGLREEIKEKTKKIREMERLRERFMVDAAHELRTPLAVLQTNLDLLSQLSRSQSSQDIKDLIESSQNRAKHLTAILEELSLLSKGKKPEELREIIKLETISEETAEELQPLADTKNINCQVKILDQDLEVIGDREMLRKVTSNLVSNAIKYGRERGKVKITLRKQKGEAELEVADNGIGISKKDLPHMFERFYRVKRKRSKEKGGVGLGLAICKWIVELHGGRIEVESKYGKGSKFRVFLPLKGTWESRMASWDYKLRRKMAPR